MSKRKMLAAEEDLANRVAKLAERRGLTVYQTVNDILEQALRAEGAGMSLREAVDRRSDMEKAREMGLTFTPEHLYYQIVELAYSGEKDSIRDLWQEMGLWYGKYFKGKGQDPVKSLTEALGYLTHGGEFGLEKGREGELTISCVNERFTKGYTELFAAFITSAFGVLGYKVMENEASRGVIKLHLAKE